jgi:hypothetical protein
MRAYGEEKVGEWKEQAGNEGKTREEYPGFKGDPAKFRKTDEASGRMDCGDLTKEECKAR